MMDPSRWMATQAVMFRPTLHVAESDPQQMENIDE